MNQAQKRKIRKVEETEAAGLVGPVQDEHGRIGYLIAWLFGVPVSVLFLIFLIRGH